MTRSHFFLFVLAIGMAFRSGVLPASERDVRFAEAGALYEAKDWAKAADAYQKLAETGEQSSELFYNLGAARYKAGSTGEAALWFRRSLLLEEGQREASLSLRYLERKLGIPTPEGGIRAGLVEQRRWVLWSVGAVLLLAALLFLSSAQALFTGGRSLRSQFVRFVCGIVLLVLSVFFMRWLGRQLPEPHDTAVIVTESVSLRSAPFQSGSIVSALPPGTPLRILRNDLGAWVYLELVTGERGYVPAEDIRQLWPIQS